MLVESKLNDFNDWKSTNYHYHYIKFKKLEWLVMMGLYLIIIRLD